MEKYRHALYRYSTGQGFNVNVDVPEIANNIASFKMIPLYTELSRPGMAVDIKREADRVSMQYEAAMQQIKVLGYDPQAGKRLKKLKLRVELIKHIMTTYPVRYIKEEDLNKLYDLYEKNAPGMDRIINEVVNQNKGVTGIDDFVGTALKVRKGYPLYDKFGRELTKKGVEEFNASEKKAEGLSGFGEEGKTNILKIIAIIAVIAAIAKMFRSKEALA